MSSSIRHDLLQPSLSDPAAVGAAPYSQQTAMLTAFFGGPLALAVLFAIDARRLGRLGRDAPWIALVVAAYAGWMLFAWTTAAGLSLQVALVEELGRRGPQIVERLIALLGAGLATLLHRKEHRSATLFGLKRPNGWVMGIALIVLGSAATWGLEAGLKAWMLGT